MPDAGAGQDASARQLAVLRALVDGLPAMLAYWDVGLKCRFANHAYERWFGVDPDRMIGRDMAEFLGPLFALNRPYVEGALRGEPQCFEREIPDPAGGRPRHSEALYMPDVDPASGAIRGFCVLVTDISPRRQREDELRAAKHELARERDVLEHFFTLSLDMMCIVGAGGYFLRVSPAFAALGYSQDELRARSFHELVHPEDAAASRETLAQHAAGVPTIRIENRYRCKDGSYRWLAWSGAADAGGTLYMIARDVTEAKRSHDAVVRAKEAAEAANRELEAFSYSVAHDLRTPLRAIDGFSLALLEDCAERLEPQDQQYLVRVRAAAQHMAELIDDLLSLSRVSRTTVIRERVDLSALARATIAGLQRAEPDRTVAVTIQGELYGDGDPRLLAVALDNLLGNAWKFTGRCAEPRIELGANVERGRRVYFVRDNGAGFDMTFANKLFGVFERLHSQTEFEGTGVGLATVHRVISRHNGRVWAEAAPGRGATFYFTLYEGERATGEPIHVVRAG